MSLTIPAGILPIDGRFGSGPSKVRDSAVHHLVESGLLGTSHRQPPVKQLVAHIQEMLAELYNLPDAFSVTLGNGGATAFWDVATVSLIENRSAHGVCGEFSRKFFNASKSAPFLEEPVLTEVLFGQGVLPQAVPGVDTYGWTHLETSTGAVSPVLRPEGADDGAIVLIDGTSAAGGMRLDVTQCDGYYFSPQKNFGSEGGLWIAIHSPALVERASRVESSRWVPQFLSFSSAAENSAKNQTLNTPAISTLLLLEDQLSWLLENGGLDFAVRRTTESSDLLYAWAEENPLVTPFAAKEARSNLVVTLDFSDQVDTAELIKTLRANGIVDVDPYRSLNRNQLRIAVYASVDPDDVRALICSLDWVLERTQL